MALFRLDRRTGASETKKNGPAYPVRRKNDASRLRLHLLVLVVTTLTYFSARLYWQSVAGDWTDWQSRVVLVEKDHESSSSITQNFDETQIKDIVKLTSVPPSPRPLDPTIAAFYNIYVSKEQEKATPTVLKIIEEQINQLAQSHAASPKFNTTVFYNTIGLQSAVNETFMNNLCTGRNNITCKHLQHYDTGFEEVTLQALYEHCQTHETDLAMYFHSKGISHNSESIAVYSMYILSNPKSCCPGSFHPRNQQPWRVRLMAAISNKLCVEPANKTCNVCGLNFASHFSHFMPGNFWIAPCSYVKKLRPPKLFEGDMINAANQISDLQRQNVIDRKAVFPDADWSQGTGRYAAG